MTFPPTDAPAISGPGSSSNGFYTINWSGMAGATYKMQEQTNGGARTGIGNEGSPDGTGSD
ncbi:hypothetical protein L2Y96_12745 [Luteibacter aegosomaticola]|uniref:hypothetical protein n=1 Tax=Luteibacter aegosomaticola TaxID=2911538 RepID=UPI001FFA50C5|nr:hypothetical protein [Luteibacter aegosomaticola]UPG88288.1 hypothetical protein L2Y96_12745 [Luteibacter aegosomaticola]